MSVTPKDVFEAWPKSYSLKSSNFSGVQNHLKSCVKTCIEVVVRSKILYAKK
jgi:hypothetical protein